LSEEKKKAIDGGREYFNHLDDLWKIMLEMERNYNDENNKIICIIIILFLLFMRIILVILF
jgi:hypothetical protein